MFRHLTQFILIIVCAVGALVTGTTPARAETTIPGAYYTTDVTWTLAGSPYIVTDHVYVANQATLTIEPGVVVKFKSTKSLVVASTAKLIAQGTAAKPIQFTSNAATLHPGDWGNIHIEGAARLSHCDVGYGGGGDVQAQIEIKNTSDVVIEDCRIHDGAANHGIDISNSYSLFVTPLLRNLTIDHNVNFGLGQISVQMQPRYENVTMHNNGHDAVDIGWYPNGGATVGVSFTLDNSGLNGAPLWMAGGLSVDYSSVVTVTPGTTLQFPQNTSLYVGNSTPPPLLIARGTPTQPITFTSTSATPAPGDWYGLVARGTGRLHLSYCDIGYGGANDSSGGMVLFNSFDIEPNITMDHCTLHHSQLDGLRTNGMESATFSYNTIINNGRCGIVNVSGGLQPLMLRYNTIANNGGASPCGILNQSATPIDARRNWWGERSGPQNEAKNPDGKGNGVSDNVLFEPWLNRSALGVFFDPAQGGNVGTTTVRFYGFAANPALQIALQRTGQADVVGTYRGQADDGGMDYTFALGGTTPAVGHFAASGPGALPIPDPFTVVAAPPTARLDAADLLSVTVNTRFHVHFGSPVPLFVNFSNNGLIDAPPTEVRVYGAAGLTLRQSPTRAYVASTIISPTLSADGVRYGSIATFMRADMRPGTFEATPVVFVPYQVGDYPFRIEYVTSDALAPSFDKTKSAKVDLSMALQSASGTKLQTTFHVLSPTLDATGNFSFERLGATSYFSPVVEVLDDGTNVTYRLTAAVSSGLVSSAQAFGSQDANVSYQKVQEVIQLSKALNEKLRRSYYTPFIQPELERLQRLSKIACLGDLGIFNANSSNDQQVIDTANNLGEFARLSALLNGLLQYEPYSFEFSQQLRDADGALNNVWSDEIAQTLIDRMDDPLHTHPELNGLRDLLRKHNLDSNKLSTDDLMRIVNELCYKKEPKQIHIVTGVIQSFDPNDKTGNVGVGAQHFVYPNETLSYVIAFENVPTATAPAQIVVISDTLDVTRLDLSTIKLGYHSFSDTISVAGAGILPFSQEIDLRPQRNLIVRIEADLADSSTLVWRFTSLDPVTGQLPEDALQGFLLPNKNGTEGQGFVYFSIKPKAGLHEGEVIRNKATIFFDNNAPIDTPTWSNTIWQGPKVYLPLVEK